MASARKSLKKNPRKGKSRLETALESPYATIPVDLIEIPRDRLREIDEDTIRDLAISIDKVGLINAITVRVISDRPARYRLIAGNRRLHAVKQLGWTEVPVLITKLDDIRTQLIEIDENFQRQQLTALETAEHIHLREQILDELGLRATTGGQGKSSESEDSPKTTPQLAADVGMSTSNYLATASIARHIPRAVRERVHGTPLADQKTKLVEISKLDDDDQKEAVIDHIIENPKASVKKALKAIAPPTVIVEVEEPEPPEAMPALEPANEDAPVPVHVISDLTKLGILGQAAKKHDADYDHIICPWVYDFEGVAGALRGTPYARQFKAPVWLATPGRLVLVLSKAPIELPRECGDVNDLIKSIGEASK